MLVRKLSKKYSPLAASIFVAATAVHAPVTALPSTDNSTLEGDAAYDSTTATLSASEDSVIQFNGSNGSAFDIDSGEVLNLRSDGGEIDILAEIMDTQRTEISGSIEGDGLVSLYLRNEQGFLFGDGASVLNVPALVAMSNTNAFDSQDFIDFASGSEVLEILGAGGQIVLENVSLEGSELVLVASAVDIRGNVVSDASFRVAIGESVELALPSMGSGLLSVEITEALTGAGGINMRRGSSAEVESIDWQVALNNPASLAVNVGGLVKANGVSVGDDGTINIVTKGGVMGVGRLGELNASDGTEKVSLTGDTIVLDGTVAASQLDIELGNENFGLDASEGLLLADGLKYEDPSINVVGASASQDLQHTVDGFANYNVNGVRSGTAAHKSSPQTESVSFENIAKLIATDAVDNNIVITQPNGVGEVIIDSITGGALNDTFTIAGQVGSLEGSGGNDTFVMNGGEVEGIINGSDTFQSDEFDVLENVFLRDDNGDPTIEFTNQTSSDFVGGWVNIEEVIPAELPPVIPVATLSTSNINASSPLFANLNGAAESGLNLVGDNLVNTPCGFSSSAAPVIEDVSVDLGVVGAAVPAIAKEDCFDTPEYLALLNTTIYFDNDSVAILPTAAAKLDKVSSFINESNMFREVIVSGHTDSNASEAYNFVLSKRRADSAIDYMAGQGVDAQLFRSFHYGEGTPAAPNDTAENLAKNRRVVVELKK